MFEVMEAIQRIPSTARRRTMEPRPERWAGLTLQRCAGHRKDISVFSVHTILLSAAPLPPAPAGAHAERTTHQECRVRRPGTLWGGKRKGP